MQSAIGNLQEFGIVSSWRKSADSRQSGDQRGVAPVLLNQAVNDGLRVAYAAQHVLCMGLTLLPKQAVLVSYHLDPFILVTGMQVDRFCIRPDGGCHAIGPTQPRRQAQYKDEEADELGPNALDRHAPLLKCGVSSPFFAGWGNALAGGRHRT